MWSESAILKNSSLARMLVCKGEILNFTKHLRERINQNVRNVVEFRASSLSLSFSATPTANIPDYDLEFSSEHNFRKVLSSLIAASIVTIRM